MKSHVMARNGMACKDLPTSCHFEEGQDDDDARDPER